MKNLSRGRLFGAVILGIVLSGLLASQALGIALTRKSPSFATQVFPANGIATENLASAYFAAANAEETGSGTETATSEPLARAAYLSEPLTPKAISILALALPEGSERRAFVDLASKINRRDQRLLGVTLQERVMANDYAGTVRTLDHILRVRPSRSTDLFPALIGVFSQDGAVDEFAEVLDGSSAWHGKFLEFATNHPAAFNNLLELRLAVKFTDQAFDQKFIRQMVRAKQFGMADTLYARVAKTSDHNDRRSVLLWESTYAPFDWEFADKGGFRAQPSLVSDSLEIYIQPGRGGILARRLIPAPSEPFAISIAHDSQRNITSEDVELSLSCAESGAPLGSTDFSANIVSVPVNPRPPNCDLVELVLSGRAWSGRPALQGTIQPIEIAPR